MNTLQLHFLISILAGWINRGQQDVIEYLQEENRVLREQLGGRAPIGGLHHRYAWSEAA
jgi:hypothetical protein